MRYLTTFLIIFMHSFLPVLTVQAQELPPEEPRPNLKLCQNWSGIYVAEDEIPEGGMGFALENDQPRWGFEGLVTATCSLPWMRGKFDLIEVTFWDMGRVITLWVAVGVELPYGQYLITGSGTYDGDSFIRVFHPGQRVQVYLAGPQVFADHIDWSQCDTHFCHIGQQIDDTSWAGSNQLIEGSYPSRNYPLYGFLFWQVDPIGPTLVPYRQLRREIWPR
jgi:hypothetical protein